MSQRRLSSSSYRYSSRCYNGKETVQFLDAFSSYDQISRVVKDKDKTTFITDFWTYCSTIMPLEPKNAGPTYKKVIIKDFGVLIRKKIET